MFRGLRGFLSGGFLLPWAPSSAGTGNHSLDQLALPGFVQSQDVQGPPARCLPCLPTFHLPRASSPVGPQVTVSILASFTCAGRLC